MLRRAASAGRAGTRPDDSAERRPPGRPFPGGSCDLRLIERAYVAVSAIVVGDVQLGAGTSVWPQSCIRGDIAPIRVGARCSIQDQVMLHTRFGEPLEIGDDVVIGHQACVHCRSVGDGCLIGIGATVLDGVRVGAGSMIAAGAVVRPDTEVPPGVLMVGVPARVVRPVSDQDRAYIARIVAEYCTLAQRHAGGEFDGPGA